MCSNRNSASVRYFRHHHHDQFLMAYSYQKYMHEIHFVCYKLNVILFCLCTQYYYKYQLYVRICKQLSYVSFKKKNLVKSFLINKVPYWENNEQKKLSCKTSRWILAYLVYTAYRISKLIKMFRDNLCYVCLSREWILLYKFFYS